MNSPDRMDVDLHGRRVEPALGCVLEALSRLEGRPGAVLRVVHGKGTYVLAREVARLAEVDPRVAAAEPEPGNPGVTLLRLNGRRLGARDHATRIALGLMDPPERRRRR